MSRSSFKFAVLCLALSGLACNHQLAVERAESAAGPAALGIKATPLPVAAVPSDLDAPLPVDARIRVGKLPNGLTYYVLPHRKPEKRAQLWLAVNAGSVLEDEDQQGLAHFVEHMAFNGTKRFPKLTIVNFLESIGVKFGPDLNAYTSFDATVYQLQVPTDKPELVAKGIDILRDWASEVSFDATEVDKERGVVLEEWRLGRGAMMRLFDKQAKVVFHGSRYADRLTIGKPEILKTAKRDTLVRFYKDWYRPDNMAVIAVGDFKPEELVERIKTTFGDLRGPDKERPRAVAEVPPHKDPLVSIETDPEMPMAMVTVLNKMPHRSERSARDYRRALTENLYHQMVNARLAELKEKPDAPFLMAGSSTNKMVRATDVFARMAVAKTDAVEKALEVLLAETARVDQHGFGKAEFERAKRDLVRGYQQSVVNRDKEDARGFAAEIVRNFLTAETMPGVEAELALVEKLLPTITLDELNGLAKSWGGSESRVITVSGPDKMTKPTPEALLGLVKSVGSSHLEAYRDEVSKAPLVAQIPKAGKIVATREIPEIGVTEWKLSNGAKVVWKPTDFKNDEVVLSAFSPGGHSKVKDGDFESAREADDIVNASGIGKLDVTQLHKALAGRVVNVMPWIGEVQEGLRGSASKDDLETFFQLIYLAFTSPRRDQAAFDSWRARQLEAVKNRRLSPEQSFHEDLELFLAKNHPRRQPESPDSLAKVSLERALAIYRDRFADAGDFTFVLVGNVTGDRLKGLVETYVASLPSKGRKEKWRDVGVRWPEGNQTKTVVRGREPKSLVVFAVHGAQKWTKEADNDLDLLTDVLRIRLRETMREDMGAVYGVRVSGSISRRPREEYTVRVQFGCAPENVDKLKEAILAEIKALGERGVAEDYLGKVKQQWTRAHEVELKENHFWAHELALAWDFGEDPKRIPDIEWRLGRVSSDCVKQAAGHYLAGKPFVFGVLKPEGVPPAASK